MGNREGSASDVVSDLDVKYCAFILPYFLKVGLSYMLSFVLAQIETATERHWQMLLREKPQLFDGVVWCLRNFAVQDGRGLDGKNLLLDMQDKRAIKHHRLLQSSRKP